MQKIKTGRLAGKDHYIIDSNGCWVWQSSISTKGYGKFHPQKNVYLRAHIYYYERKFGKVPDGLELDHTCRNRRCVNLDHLEPVTKLENIRRGAATKLTVAEVIEIRKLGGTMKQSDIAERFKVSRTNITHILSGKTWVL